MASNFKIIKKYTFQNLTNHFLSLFFLFSHFTETVYFPTHMSSNTTRCDEPYMVSSPVVKLKLFLSQESGVT